MKQALVKPSYPAKKTKGPQKVMMNVFGPMFNSFAVVGLIDSSAAATLPRVLSNRVKNRNHSKDSQRTERRLLAATNYDKDQKVMWSRV